MFYPFLLNMWMMKRIDAEYLSKMVLLKRLTQDESDMIQATPQFD